MPHVTGLIACVTCDRWVTCSKFSCHQWILSSTACFERNSATFFVISCVFLAVVTTCASSTRVFHWAAVDPLPPSWTRARRRPLIVPSATRKLHSNNISSTVDGHPSVTSPSYCWLVEETGRSTKVNFFSRSLLLHTNRCQSFWRLNFLILFWHQRKV